MQGSNLTTRVREEFVGGDGTGRYDRGGELCQAGAIVLKDVVHDGAIETHSLYGAATPKVGSAWALPRNHPLWAPMDFECGALAVEDDAAKALALARWDPPTVIRPELTPAEIAAVQKKNKEHFEKKKDVPEGRQEFIESAKFMGRRRGYYWGRSSTSKMGYVMDYKQMRHLLRLNVGDRCEARYKGARAYFNGFVTYANDDDCTYDVRFEDGHMERRIPAEHVKPKEWKGKLKSSDDALGVFRNLRAANPQMERKDEAVRWYEQLLLWEQAGESTAADEEAQPGGPTSAMKLLSMMAENIEEAVEEAVEEAAAEEVDDVTVVPEEEEEQEEECPAASQKTAEDVVASGDCWRPESAGYNLFWDAEGAPHLTGAPTHLPWYGTDTGDCGEATRESPFDLCGDGSVLKWTTVSASGVRPTAAAKCSAHVIVTRLDGSIVESSYDNKKMEIKLFCDDYVQGFHEAVASMRSGEVSHFLIVPEKAYGRKGKFPAVPPYTKDSPRGTWLLFEIDLLGFEDVLEQEEANAITDCGSFSLLQRPKGYDWEGKDAATTGIMEKECSYCGKPQRAMHGSKSFKRCTRCKTALYCSKECSTAAWPKHKQYCTMPEDNLVCLATLQEGAEGVLTTRNEGVVGFLERRFLGLEKPKVCVIVAYRNQLPLQDRQPQLFKFVPYMVAFLGYARPQCEFTVVVATQTDDGRKFNRGRLMNAAFEECVNGQGFDSVVFHDVDLLPQEEMMPYYAVPPESNRPLHLGGAWRTKYRSPDFVGGVLAFRPEDYVKCNGFPNDCWGWGLDDAEMALRIKEAGMRVVKPRLSNNAYSDVDALNMHNIVMSDERGYYHEWWNMDMENGKCDPKVNGPIDWAVYKRWWKTRGLADIKGHSELIARTHEFGGRVVRLLFELQNDQERKEGVVALVSARVCLKASLDCNMVGPVFDAALKQTRAYAAQGNLRSATPRLLHGNKNLLTPDERRTLGHHGGNKEQEPAAASSKKDKGRRRLTGGVSPGAIEQR